MVCRLLGSLVFAALTSACVDGAASPRTSLDEAEPFDACDRPISLNEVARRASESDAVLIGEMHGHPLGLKVAAALFARIAADAPTTALGMEFLERDTQPAVDDYLAGRIDRPTFIQRARLHAKAPEPGHLAMIDEAKRLHLPVVATNAPRSYAKKARVEGFEALRSLPASEQALFVIPEALPSGRYAKDFADMMGGHDGSSPHAKLSHEPTNPTHDGESRAVAFFRAQALWDATMAESVAHTVDSGRHPVVLEVGKFHVDHHGGTPQMLARERPTTKIFTISLVESKDDISPGLADAVIIVGPAPSEAE